jgi:hypothetical protein
MKITIIISDKAVYKDGLSYLDLNLSTANIPSDIHVLQWEHNAGWIEYKNHVKPNEFISYLPQWANDAVTVWQQTYDAEQATNLIEKQKTQQAETM